MRAYHLKICECGCVNGVDVEADDDVWEPSLWFMNCGHSWQDVMYDVIEDGGLMVMWKERGYDEEEGQH